MKKETKRDFYWLKNDGANLKLLKKLYPTASREEIENTFRERNWQAICKKAHSMGFHRVRQDGWNEELDALIRAGFKESQQPNLSLADRHQLKQILITKVNRAAAKKNILAKKWKTILNHANEELSLSWSASAAVVGGSQSAKIVSDASKKSPRPELTPEEQKMVDILTKSGFCHEKQVAAALNRSVASVSKLAQQLHDKKIFIVKNDKTFYLGTAAVELAPEEMVILRREVRVGFIADTLLGSKSEQPTNLCRAFQIAECEGVDFMVHLGVSAGKPTPAKRDEFHKHTVDDQIEYIVANYPRSKKFKTRLISGYHDMQWRREGRNILAEVCMERDDLIYRGDWQSDFPLRRGTENGGRWPIMKAAYHGGDDSPYSKSYPIQGFAENLIQDVGDLYLKSRPDIAVVAGQGIFCDLSGGTIPHLISIPGLRLVSKSVMRKKRRSVVPTIGLIILTIRANSNGNCSVVKNVYPLQAVKDDYHEKLSEDKTLFEGQIDEKRAILKLLEESPKTLGELTQVLDKSDATVKSWITELQKDGFDILTPEDPGNPSKNYKLRMDSRARFNAPKIDFKKYFATTIEQGAVSDTHIGHNSELLQILHGAYDIFEARKIKVVSHCGDITNGAPKHEEHNKGEVREFRATPLTNDIISLYPKRKDITTDAILGDHDRWFLDSIGYDLLDPVAKVRPDIRHLGVQQGERFEDGDRVITLLRHFNWGTGYAKSYKPQQVAEGLLKEIEKEIQRYRDKILAVLSGGGHVYCAMLYKGIVFILMPCLQGKTGFITGLGKLSDVGFIIYSITHNEDGALTRFTVEYFDRGAEALALTRENVELHLKNLKLALSKDKK